MTNPIRYILFSITLLTANSAFGQAQIELREEVEMDHDDVQLGDIARIHAADPDVRQHISELDMGVLDGETTGLMIGRSRVAIRLRLSGLDASEFQISGATKSVVRRRVPQVVTDSAIESAAVPTMEDALGVPASQLRVRLNSPMMATLPKQVQDEVGLRVEVQSPLSARIGTVSLTVRLWRGPQLVFSRSGRFEVFQQQHVAVTRTSLPRGHVIEARDVQFTDRFLAIPADQLDESQVIGRQVRNTLPAGRMIAVRDLLAAPTPKQKQLIKARDNVSVTAISGQLRVKLTAAEAMEAGKAGDVIKIRNLKSKEIITGRVTGAGQVEIRL